MSNKQNNPVAAPDIDEIAEQAEQGHDVSEHFTNQPVVKQFISIDFPLELLQAIDHECRQIGVTRQAWIKLACDERLRQVRLGRAALQKAGLEQAA